MDIDFFREKVVFQPFIVISAKLDTRREDAAISPRRRRDDAAFTRR